MGYYIPNNQPISSREGVEEVSLPAFNDIPEGKALICEVDNVYFQANALAFSEEELKRFTNPTDNRNKRWFLMDKELAHISCGYNGI